MKRLWIMLLAITPFASAFACEKADAKEVKDQATEEAGNAHSKCHCEENVETEKTVD